MNSQLQKNTDQQTNRVDGFYIVKPNTPKDWMSCDKNGMTICFFSSLEGEFTFSGVDSAVASYAPSRFSFISECPIDFA